jgi:hypothetical protein
VRFPSANACVEGCGAVANFYVTLRLGSALGTSVPLLYACLPCAHKNTHTRSDGRAVIDAVTDANGYVTLLNAALFRRLCVYTAVLHFHIILKK